MGECFLNEFVEVEISGVWRENFIKLFTQHRFLGYLPVGREFFEIEELAIKAPILAQEIFQYCLKGFQFGTELAVWLFIVQPAQWVCCQGYLTIFFKAIAHEQLYGGEVLLGVVVSKGE